jgi:hypothetical protein
MAEKHKSKYKKPENTKPTHRKDLKDYTMDDKDGGLNPKSTKDKQLNVLRKTDKEMVDTGDMYIKYKADDQLYKDLEDGEWEPKHAAKVMKKRQDKDEKDNKENIQDKIENLTREQKERLVREYVRRKIYKMLVEQPTPAEETPEEPAPDAAPTDATATPPPTDATATPPAPDAAALPTDTATPPAPDAAATTTPTTPPASTPSPEAGAEQPAGGEEELSPESKEAIAVEKFVKQLKSDGGNIARVKTLAKVFNMVMKEAEPEDQQNFFKLLRQYSIKKLSNINNEMNQQEKQ